MYSGLQPCIQAYVRVDLPALIRVYSPASAYIGPHPCIPACKLASSRVTRAVYTGLHQNGLQPCYPGSVYWPTPVYTGVHPCIQAYTRVYWPTTVHTGVHPRILAYVRVYLPKSTFAGVHPCKLVGVWSSHMYSCQHPCIPAYISVDWAASAPVYTVLRPCIQAYIRVYWPQYTRVYQPSPV